jgi:hypothetical protein
MTYVLAGLTGAERRGYDGQLCVLARVSEVEGETILLADVTIPDGAMSFDALSEAMMAGEAIMGHNREFTPPLNLVVGEVQDDGLGALLLPPESKKSDQLVRTAALRYGVAVKRLLPV